jgi:hypothetical protein
MTDSLVENIKMSFSGFHSHAAHSPSKSVMLQKNLQHELIKLQFHSILSSSFNQEALIYFSCFFPVPELRKSAPI